MDLRTTYSKKTSYGKVSNIPADTLKKMYETMLRIRVTEDKVADLIIAEEIMCPCHLYTGQEAVASGVCASLVKEDFVFSTHRSHGHYIAKGGSIRSLFAELYGKETGCSHGRGGSMHLASPEIGLPGSSAIIGGTMPLAVGAALSFSIRKTDNVAVSFFGDGATNEGVFYEALNFAALKKLPVIFVCENNLYATHMPIASCTADTSLYKKARTFGLSSKRINGNDIRQVFVAAREMIEVARGGGGPAFLECMTYRWRGHVGPYWDLDKGIRTHEELKKWMAKCPVKTAEKILKSNNIMSEAEIIQAHESMEKEIEEAVTFAREAPHPNAETLYHNLFKG